MSAKHEERFSSDHNLHVTQERTFCSGVLSVTTSFRLVVTGNTELKHLDRIIRILKLQKEILEEDDDESPVSAAPAKGCELCENHSSHLDQIGFHHVIEGERVECRAHSVKPESTQEVKT